MASQLTSAQKIALKNHILANTANVQLTAGVNTQIKDVPQIPDNAPTVRDWYNLAASPSFTVWKKLLSLSLIGKAFNGTELAGLTTANLQRLQTIGQYSVEGINPSLADQRQFFNDVFSGSGGTITRASLLALWKSVASNAKKLFSTGTGSDADPAVTDSNVSDTFTLTSDDVVAAWAA